MATRKTSSKKSTDLATVSSYAIAQVSKDDLEAIIGTNLGEENLSPNDFEKIKVPSGGGLAWTVVDEAGEETPAKEVEGIILFQHTARTWWETAIEESAGNEPPTCFSPDGRMGLGDIGDGKRTRDCATCPLNQFGSGKNSAKACKETRVLYLIRQGELLPTIVRVPPSSLGAIRKYLLRLTSKQVRYDSVTTKLTLEKAKNAQGIDYSKIVFSRGELVPETLLEQVQAYARLLGGIIERANSSAAFVGEVVADAPSE